MCVRLRKPNKTNFMLFASLILFVALVNSLCLPSKLSVIFFLDFLCFLTEHVVLGRLASVYTQQRACRVQQHIRTATMRFGGLFFIISCFLVFWPISTVSAPVCLGNCSSHGLCIGNDVCQCNLGYLGANCSISANQLGQRVTVGK